MAYGKCIECNHNSDNHCLIYNGPPSNPNHSYYCAYYIKRQDRFLRGDKMSKKCGQCINFNPEKKPYTCDADRASSGANDFILSCPKFKLKLTERGQNMKKGDVVLIDDCSYSRTIMDGELKYKSYGVIRGECKDKWVILETDCKFPKTGSWSDRCNNTVIQNTVNGTVVFIEQRFLKPATHTLVIDDKSVTLSHESYENLKKQFIN